MKIGFKSFFIMMGVIFAIFPKLLFANSAEVLAIKLIPQNNASRFIAVLNHPTLFRVFTLNHPKRIVIDLKHTKLGFPHKALDKIGNKDIAKIRTGHPVAFTERLVLELKNPVNYKVFSDNTHVIIDLISCPAPIFTKKTPKCSVKCPMKCAAIKSKKIKKMQAVSPLVARMRQMIIVIDPGHGGKDTGAIGPSGTKEKDVVLEISYKLADCINRHPNMHAELTRKGDYFLTLRERLQFAREKKADIFIAIHADSYFDDRSTGVSVFSLSRRGATSEAARWLAKNENNSELGGVNLNGLDDQSSVVRSVLIDLAQAATIRDSVKLGNQLLDSLEEVTSLHYKNVEQAPFVVLKSPDILSVLVETGFISNPIEEERLRQKKYQTILANAIFTGMKNYLKKNPITLTT